MYGLFMLVYQKGEQYIVCIMLYLCLQVSQFLFCFLLFGYFGCCLTREAFVLSTSNMQGRTDLFRLLGRKSPFLPLQHHLKGE